MNSVAIMGAGAVGGFFGALIARSGRPVSFIARGAHLAAIRSAGLTVERDGQPPLVIRDARATDDPAEIGPVDLVLFTPKATDLEEAAARMVPLLRADTVVLPLLNGLDVAERLAPVIGRERVLAGVCMIFSTIASPGVIRQTGSLNRIVLGEVAGGTSARAQAVLELLRRADIPADGSDRMIDELWKKFYFLDPFASVCALTLSPIGPVREDPDTRAVLVGCVDEVRTLADAVGVTLPPVAEQMAVFDRLPPGNTPSLLRALQTGGKLEIDALQGEVVQIGRRLGIPTPVHQLIYAALKIRAVAANAATSRSP